MKFLEGINPREYQQKIFEKCVDKNCLVIIPTGLGKTLIALMLAINRMEKYPKEKILFLAPTKPLVEQNMNYFKKHLPDLFAEINIFTGETNALERKKIWQKSDIIFSTPQCIANDLKNKLYNLEEVSLLVEDEAHRCIKNYDYNFVAEKYKNQAKHQRILGLTASPGSEPKRIEEICKNLSIEEVEAKTRESDDVKKYLQELKIEKRVVELPSEFEEIKGKLKKIYNSYLEELKSRKLFWKNYSKTGLIELQKKIMSAIANGNKNYNYFLSASACANAIKIQYALELLETQTVKSLNEYMQELFKQASEKKSKGVIKLTNNPEFNSAYVLVNELISKGIEHPKIEKITSLIEEEVKNNEKTKILVFTQFRNTAMLISKKINQLAGVNSEVFLGQAKKKTEKGITGMDQKRQKEIIEEFSNGKINVLCSTSIGEEGLDIPEVNMVIFYESVPSAIRKIQRSGRTARLSKGKLIMLITKGTRDETFYYVANSKEKKMYKAIEEVRAGLSKNKKESQKNITEYLIKRDSENLFKKN